MNASNVTLAAVAVVGALAGVVVGHFATRSDRPYTEMEPKADFVWTFNEATPKDLNEFYKKLSTGGTRPAVFRRDMALVELDASGKKTCSEPQELKNSGGRWCEPPKPCDNNSDMGQQVTQRVGFKNQAALQEALDLLSSTTPPPPQ
jgi:hypothetical protein